METAEPSITGDVAFEGPSETNLDPVDHKENSVASDSVHGDEAAPKTENDEAETNDNDEYAYIQRGGFTSEIFKIEIKKLSKKITPNMLRKFVAGKGLKPKKVKLLKMNYEVKAYVCFSCEEEREHAIKEINGCQWKGCNLVANPAAPKADPLQVMKKMEDSDEPAAKRARMDNAEDDMDPETKLKNSVTPFWNKPYQEQLEHKTNDMKEFIRKLGRQIERNNNQLFKWFVMNKKVNQGLCCPLESIRESPVRVGYRNKCEFTIGWSLDGSDHVVGFRYGKYRGGCSSVGDATVCSIVPESMLRLVKHMHHYIQTVSTTTNPHYGGVYDPETQRGHWRLLTVRTTITGQTMAMIDFHPQQLTQDEINKVKQSLTDYFTENARDDVTSLYFHVNREKTTGANDVTPYELILGECCITETLSGLSFSISPLAFFQVNTLAAEVLYSEVKRMCCDLSDAGKETTVLDVCCGTGTIGLTMASDVKRVIGVEMVQSAVTDAIHNAKLNNITNAEYKCGKAEDVLPDLMSRVVRDTDHVVAVVDPPRAGLHPKVVHALRRCEELKSLVYVSCNPPAALNNMVDLCRAESKRVRGEPFVPVRAVCVDLFPDTPHCELVILFERYDSQRHVPSQGQVQQGQGQGQEQMDNHGQGQINEDQNQGQNEGQVQEPDIVGN